VSALRVVFLGTPEFAAESLRAIHGAGFRIPLVVTQPERPRGRGKKVKPTPVGALASSLGLRLAMPERTTDAEFFSDLGDLRPDVIAVVAFGEILRRQVLELPRLGCVNVHASLLPKYRGMAPIERAILRGDRWTGVTTIRMDAGVDTGDILLQRATPIGPEETGGALTERLAKLGGEVLVETLRGLAKDSIPPVRQIGLASSYAPRLEKEEGGIRWDRPATEVLNQIRAFTPRPGAFARLPGGERGDGDSGPPETFKVTGATIADLLPASELSGTVLGVDREGIRVQTGSGTILLEEVRPEGKPTMKAAAFARGRGIRAGSRLGAPGPDGPERTE
jgi:methionyl-tRNA formyltransferase